MKSLFLLFLLAVLIFAAMVFFGNIELPDHTGQKAYDDVLYQSSESTGINLENTVDLASDTYSTIEKGVNWIVNGNQ